MDRLGRHYVKLCKPGTERQVLHDPITCESKMFELTEGGRMGVDRAGRD
jgi:hypothetical protein